METFEGYLIMKQFALGAKSDGYTAYLFIGPNKVFKLYREEVLPIHDTFFYKYHLKFVSISGIIHPRIRSINVDSIEFVEDPFLPSTDISNEVPESID